MLAYPLVEGAPYFPPLGGEGALGRRASGAANSVFLPVSYA